MKIFGFDLTFAYECVCDVYNLLSAYKQMQDKKIKRLQEKAENVETATIDESVEEGAIDE